MSFDKTYETAVLEGMTSVSALIHAKADGINDRPMNEVWFDKDKLNSKRREYEYLRHQSEAAGYSLLTVSAEEINARATGNTHGGVIALCGDRTVPDLSEANLKQDGFYVMLEGIEDPFNFGYAMRSLYAAGVDGIVLTPRNWLSATGTVAKASAGTSELFPCFTAESAESAVRVFKNHGYNVLCAGIRDSVSIYESTVTKPIFLIIGGEKRGISSAVLSLADEVVRIDYGRTFMGSLSTASAASVLAFEIMRRNRKV